MSDRNLKETLMTKIITPGLTLVDEAELPSAALRNPSLMGIAASSVDPWADLADLIPTPRRQPPSKEEDLPKTPNPSPELDEDLPEIYDMGGD
jgi:hypothetical protein